MSPPQKVCSKRTGCQRVCASAAHFDLALKGDHLRDPRRAARRVSGLGARDSCNY